MKNCTKAKRIRSSLTYKLHFESKEHLNEAIESPLTLGYERLNIPEYKFLPLRCYNCQQYGHPARIYPNSMRCSQCGEGRINSKETPCTNDLKFALGSSKSHPWYSIKCPVVQKNLKHWPWRSNSNIEFFFVALEVNTTMVYSVYMLTNYQDFASDDLPEPVPALQDP